MEDDAIAEAIIAAHGRHERYATIAALANDPMRAYRVQDRVIAHRIDAGRGRIVGWKIGLTTITMQVMCGVDTPIAGAILANTTHRSGARVEAARFTRLGVESEIALRVGATPPEGAALDTDAVLASIDAVAAAFELIDDRDADYATLDAHTMIADNSWNGGIVLGEPVPVERVGSFIGLRGELVRDGVSLGTGESADTLAIVGWLSDLLRARGRRLEPGQWVMTGSVVRTEFAKPGEHYRLTVDGLPPVEAVIE